MKINKKQYSSVTEMVRDTIDDPAFVADFEKHLAETQIAKKLFVLRNSCGLSEQDVAKKMGCSTSRVSKLEHGKDADLRLGDLFAYLAALGVDATITVRHNGQAVEIARLGDDLANPGVEDEAERPKQKRAINGETTPGKQARIENQARRASTKKVLAK